MDVVPDAGVRRQDPAMNKEQIRVEYRAVDQNHVAETACTRMSLDGVQVTSRVGTENPQREA
jgi:hypothetical protein